MNREKIIDAIAAVGILFLNTADIAVKNNISTSMANLLNFHLELQLDLLKEVLDDKYDILHWWFYDTDCATAGENGDEYPADKDITLIMDGKKHLINSPTALYDAILLSHDQKNLKGFPANKEGFYDKSFVKFPNV